MNQLAKSLIRLLLALTTVLIVLAGCKKDNEPAPQIPPQSTFLMDFSAFSNPEDTTSAREIATYHNWGYSYTNVVTWNALITVGLAVPVATFLESFNHEAVYHPNQNNWTWSYNVTSGFVVYEAELTGYLQSDSVVWEMRITKGNEFSDFLWYYGKSAIGQTGGYWILNDNPTNPEPLLGIYWARYSDGTADIRYKNIVPGGPEYGGYIYYATFTGDLNRKYSIYNKGLDNRTDIEWNSTDFHGHVSDPMHFGDSDWHCWDTLLMDTECQ